MTLSNVAIYEALDLKRIVITPEPSPRYLEVGQDSPFDTHSVDLRLGRYLSVPGRSPWRSLTSDQSRLCSARTCRSGS